MKSKDISKNIPQHFKQIIDVLSVTTKVCSENNIQVFLLGALARDIVLKYLYEVDKEWRATEDIDLAINIDGWENYKKLTDILTGEYQFKMDSKISHRFYYKESTVIDIIPYGTIAEKDGSILLPPEFTRKLSVIGFAEVYNFTERLKLSDNPALEINIASLPGLAILKVISWYERYPSRKHDATDIGIIISNYLETGNKDRFFKLAASEENEFVYMVGLGQLLGEDMKEICSVETRDFLCKILDENKDKFATDLGVEKSIDSSIDIVKGILKGLKGG